MKPAAFTYHAPTSVAECLQLLAAHGEEAAVLAGGQSLLPLMRFRLAQPGHVVSLRQAGSELASIERRGDALLIGARATYAQVQASPLVRADCPALPRAIALIATPAVRSRGTVCGNLCQADPASELPALALLLQARLHLHSAGGVRVVPAGEFFQGPYMTARRADELLAAVEFPVQPAGQRVSILEITRLRGGFPLAGLALAVVPAGAGWTGFRVSCFGVHPVQLRLAAVEAVLGRQGLGSAALQEAGAALEAAIHPHDDAFASAAYRRRATRTLLERAVAEVCAEPATP